MGSRSGEATVPGRANSATLCLKAATASGWQFASPATNPVSKSKFRSFSGVLHNGLSDWLQPLQRRVCKLGDGDSKFACHPLLAAGELRQRPSIELPVVPVALRLIRVLLQPAACISSHGRALRP